MLCYDNDGDGSLKIWDVSLDAQAILAIINSALDTQIDNLHRVSVLIGNCRPSI